MHHNDSEECVRLVSAVSRNEGFVPKLRLLGNSSLPRLAVESQDFNGAIKIAASTV